MNEVGTNQRKIIHIDMDCFFAAIEQRDNPALRGKPVGVGGESRRGVLCTASYEARAFGCRSAMPVYKALELCPQLLLVPVRFDVYKAVSLQIRAIFGRFTELIEPLSLDEAYLDISHWQSSPAAVAREVRAQIFEETGLTASAGVGPNKLIAKIASDLNKPNGQYEITSAQVSEFMRQLPVGKIWGVGKKMRDKLEARGIMTCGDLQRFDKISMATQFGRWGIELYHLCRGIDDREVEVSRMRKTISKETTFTDDVGDVSVLLPKVIELLAEVQDIYDTRYSDRQIKSVVVKVKFADFTRTTIERASKKIEADLAGALLYEGVARGGGKAVRLIGVGVRLADDEGDRQLDMGFEC